MTTAQLEGLIDELNTERKGSEVGPDASREERRVAFLVGVRCNALIYSARVALRERRARKGDSRAAAIERCRIGWSLRHQPSVTQESLTEEMIREVRDRAMNGSPLSEDTLVALGDLILDEGDPDTNIADARDRICAWINQQNTRERVRAPR